MLTKLKTRNAVVASIVDFIMTTQECFTQKGVDKDKSEKDFNASIAGCDNFIQQLVSIRDNLIHSIDCKESFDEAEKGDFGYNKDQQKAFLTLLVNLQSPNQQTIQTNLKTLKDLQPKYNTLT